MQLSLDLVRFILTKPAILELHINLHQNTNIPG